MDREAMVRSWEDGSWPRPPRRPRRAGRDKNVREEMFNIVDWHVCLFPRGYSEGNPDLVVPETIASVAEVVDTAAAGARLAELEAAGVLSARFRVPADERVAFRNKTVRNVGGTWASEAEFRYGPARMTVDSSTTPQQFLNRLFWYSWERRGVCVSLRKKNVYNRRELERVRVVPVPCGWDGMAREILRDGEPFRRLAASRGIVVDEDGWGQLPDPPPPRKCAECGRELGVRKHTEASCRNNIASDVMAP